MVCRCYIVKRFKRSVNTENKKTNTGYDAHYDAYDDAHGRAGDTRIFLRNNC